MKERQKYSAPKVEIWEQGGSVVVTVGETVIHITEDGILVCGAEHVTFRTE